MMNPNEPVIDPVAKTVTIPLPTYIRMTRGTYGNNGLAAEELDNFLMYVYKVKRCPQKLPHNWTECPFAHRGEKAKRRDPRKFPYQGTACPEWKQTEDCSRGKNCEYAHGVFEYWLHPTRYRTKLCDEGLSCTRRICFFAHSPQQLRAIATSYSRCHDIGKPMAASPDPLSVPIPVAVPVPVLVPVPAGPSTTLQPPAAGGSRTISNLCQGCGANVVTSRPAASSARDNKMSYFAYEPPEEAAAPRRNCYYCEDCIAAAEKAAIVAMTTHAFAAPMTGRLRGADYVPLPPMMPGPAAPDPPPTTTQEELDLGGLPDLGWVQDLIQ